LGEGREYLSGFSKEVSSGVRGRRTVLRNLVREDAKRMSQACAMERRKRRMSISMPTNYKYVRSM
jgi:hypothetical protein